LPALAGTGMKDGEVVCAEAGGVTPAGKKALDDFKTAYQKKFKQEVVIYAPYTYDALMTMVEAMQKAGSSDPKVYLPELAKIHHKGVTGDIAFDPKGDILNGTLTLYSYKDGKRTLLSVVK